MALLDPNRSPDKAGRLRRLASSCLDRLPGNQQNRIRGMIERAKEAWVARFRSYGMAELVACIRSMGIRAGDTIMLHSAFKASNGFKGSPRGVADAFLEVLGETGNLLMVSLPTTGTSHEYLSRITVFDIRKVPSRMGLVSEFFRRRDGVLRSLHPSHPILASGPKAAWILGDHDQCLYPCGPGSPFDKAVELGGKVVLFDTGLDKMTFFHWLEHRIQHRVDPPLYQEEPFDVRVVDHKGNERTVRTYAFSQEIIERRRDYVLHRELWKEGIVRTARVGNTRILAAELEDVIRCVDKMAERGLFFYELS